MVQEIRYPQEKRMAGETASEILAGLLGMAKEDAQHLLDRLAGGMTAELLDRRRLSVDGLGSLSIVHEQPVRTTTPSGTVCLPPGNRVVFDARQRGTGHLGALAVTRLGMAKEESQRFAKAITALVGQLGSGFKILELRGFGSFSVKVPGSVHFEPASALEALLNSAYEGLKAVTISGSEAPPEPRRERPKMSLPFGKVLALVTVIALFAGGYVLYRNFLSGGTGKPSAAEPVVHSTAPMRAGGVVLPASAPADSVALLKGRYTVVVSTYSTSKVARQEVSRFSASGQRVMVWPVSHKGLRYYRIVTGDFPTWQAARDSMKLMPQSLSGHSYIQQASKNVVLYGEQGL